jgi:hypothetical protein
MFSSFLQHFCFSQHPTPLWTDSENGLTSILYPAGTGSNAIRPGIALNAAGSDVLPPGKGGKYRACLTSRPPVFIGRCCKLVRDHFSIPLGKPRRRHNFLNCCQQTQRQPH